MIDALGVPIEVGDKVLFPSSGVMEVGEVHGFVGQYVGVITTYGNKKKKRADVLINQTKIHEVLSEKWPENYV